MVIANADSSIIDRHTVGPSDPVSGRLKTIFTARAVTTPKSHLGTRLSKAGRLNMTTLARDLGIVVSLVRVDVMSLYNTQWSSSVTHGFTIARGTEPPW